MACTFKEIPGLHGLRGLSKLPIVAMVVVALLLPCLSLANEYAGLIEPNKNFVLSEQDKQFIKSLGPLKVMIDDNFVPLSSYDSKTRSFQGISVDLFRHLVDRLGLKYQLLHDKSLSWSDKVELFKKRKIDLLMPVSFTEERAKVGIFTASFYDTYYGVIAKKSSNFRIKQTKDLAAYRVGVTKASAIIPFIQTFVPANRIIQYDNQADLYQGVRNNHVDVALQNKNVFHDDRFNLGFVDLTLLHTIVESPRRYAYYLNKTEQYKYLAAIIDRYLAGVDHSSLLARYEQGEEELILRYTEQKHQKKLLVLGIIVTFTLFVLLAITYLNHRRFTVKLAANLEELERQKKRVEKSEVKYRGLFDHSRDALMILEPPCWTFSSGNQASVNMFRASNEAEFWSFGPWDLSPGRQPDGRASAEKAIEMVETAIREGYFFFEWTYRRINGEEFSADVLLTRITDDEKMILQANIRDITERKQTEIALSTSSKLLQSVINTAPMSVFWKDKESRYLGCNLGFANDAGVLHPDDLIGKDDFQLAWKEQAEHYQNDDRYVIESGTPRLSYEEPQTRPDGNQIWLRTSKVPLTNEANEIIGVLGMYEDITERKRIEDDKLKLEGQLLQSQKMEAVGQLAGGVAHDFNNMLAVILGYSEMSLMNMDPSQPHYANLIEISTAAERSADLTRQLLAFARKQAIIPRVVDLNETIAGMLKMLQRVIGEAIHLSWQPSPDLWSVKLDPSQLDQILANLCINARDAIANIGRITIETGNSLLDVTYCAAHTYIEPGEYVRFEVSDNGRGMDKETLAHIFEPFFTTKGVGEGTGLGLATVYGIVKQNNGFINVTSEPGQGSTFTIYLPRHMGESGQTALKVAAVVPLPHGNETVLLVEDEPTILKMAALILEDQGYTVLVAGTASEAIRLFQEQADEIHLMITDVVMPDMNGRDLLNKLQSLTPQLKCLFMSGYTADIIAHHGVLDESVHFIQKPFSLPDLAKKVREVLESKSCA